MRDVASLIVTLGILFAMPDVLPMVSMQSAIAQEASPKEFASLSQVSQPKIRPETIDINAMTLKSDFTVFMNGDCPAELRLKALRKLWVLLPPTPIDENAAF
jgi:hypothetical protein